MELKKDNQTFFTNYSHLIFFVLLCLFSLQLAFFTNSISKSVDNWAIVFSRDNDAANGIRLAQISDWTTDNHYYNYGNLYFRIAHTFQKLDPSISINDINRFSEDSDKSHHFTLMFISMLSFYGISALISYLFTNSKNNFLISMIILNSIFMSNNYWISKVFGVHPDLLLCFLISLSVFFTAKYLVSKENNVQNSSLINFQADISQGIIEEDLSKTRFITNKYMIVSAISWGLALAVKLSALFYLPVLFIVFLLPFKKSDVPEVIKFFIILFAIFFIVDFPQNFKFISMYEFIKYQSAFSLPATFESISEFLVLLYRQYVSFLPALFFICIFLSDRNNFKLKRNSLIKLLCISLIPFVFLLQRNITSPHEHYPLPIVSGLLIFTAIALINLKYYFIENRGANLNFKGYIPLTIFLFIAVISLKFLPNASSKILESDLKCREEARSIYSLEKKYQLAKLKTHVDPYVPFDQSLGFVRNNWFKTMADIAPGNADILILSKNYYSRYLAKEASHYIKQDTKNFDQIKKFYEVFSNKNITTDIHNQKWQKLQEDQCGWEIWARIKK